MLKHPIDRGTRRRAKFKKEVLDKETKDERSARIQKKLAFESATLKDADNAIEEWTQRDFNLD